MEVIMKTFLSRLIVKFLRNAIFSKKTLFSFVLITLCSYNLHSMGNPALEAAVAEIVAVLQNDGLAKAIGKDTQADRTA